jgi:lipoate-protein ligase A
MRAVRGRAADIEADRAVTRSLLADARDSGEAAVRAWTPHRQVAFGRRDARADGYQRARAAARERGYPPYERSTGGRAVAYTGSTVAFLRAEPAETAREGIDARYEALLTDVQRALAGLGVDAERGEPPDSFCPGTHSLQADGKVVGAAQRVQQGVGLAAGICVVRDREAIASVLEPVYEALAVPFDPDTVGSLERALDGTVGPQEACRAIERELAGPDAAVERLSSLDADRA